MSHRTEPFTISFTLSPETVSSLFDLIVSATGDDTVNRKAERRKEVSEKAIYGKAKIPDELHLMVSRLQASELLQLSTRTIDNLKREGLMPQPVRIGRAVRWNRAELVAWVDAGCPDCNESKLKSKIAEASVIRTRQNRSSKQDSPSSQGRKLKQKTRRVTREKPSKLDTPFHKYLISIGLDCTKLPAFTNGQIRKLAELDLPSIHGWLHKGRELPARAGELMKAKLLLQYPLDEFGLEDPT